MMRIALAAVAVCLLASAAFAAPRDYEQKLPQDVNGMTLRQVEGGDDTLLAHYGERVGRATLRIFGAPPADQNGADRTDEAPDTPAAQRALFQVLDHNLEDGTNALGPDYQTAPARLMGIDVDGVNLFCGVIERTQSETTAGGEEPMLLMDRACAAQKGSDVITASVTTPVRGDQMRDDMTEGQIVFLGVLIGTLLKAE